MEYKGKQPKYFSALFTLNGYLGPDRRSFLENTLDIVSYLPEDQRMPVVACGAQLLRNDYERWASAQRMADYRALGCFTFCSTFGDLSAALFQIINRTAPPLPPGSASAAPPPSPAVALRGRIDEVEDSGRASFAGNFAAGGAPGGSAAAAAAIEYAGIEHAATVPLFPASPGLAGAGGAAATVPQPLPHLHAPQPPRAAE